MIFGVTDILVSGAVIIGEITQDIKLLYPYIYWKWTVLIVSACVVGLSTLLIAVSYILLQTDRSDYFLGIGVFMGEIWGGIALIIIVLNIIPAKIIEHYQKELLDMENRKALPLLKFVFCN